MISIPIILLVALIVALVATCIANWNKQGKIYQLEAEKRELEAEKSKVRELHTSLSDKENLLEGDKMHFERVGNGLLASLNELYTKSNTLSEALNRIAALVGADPFMKSTFFNYSER
jgi:septal ring factor EnvC (AmiA/AmiB activator)